MLAKQYRLTKEQDFKRVSTSGRSFFSSLFRVRLIGNSLDLSRFAIVTSNKLSKKAVVRNKIRRQISEILRLNIKKFVEGSDIVIWPKTTALDKSYGELEEQLLKLLAKAKVVK